MRLGRYIPGRTARDLLKRSAPFRSGRATGDSKSGLSRTPSMAAVGKVLPKKGSTGDECRARSRSGDTQTGNLIDANGVRVVDPITGRARRLDFAVLEGGVGVDAIEVTSQGATKRVQLRREGRIRGAGGQYVRGPGELVYWVPPSRLLQLK